MENAVILCVDDERVVLNGLQVQLGREFGAQYTLEMAESGEEAMEIVEKSEIEINIPPRALNFEGRGK